MKVQLITDGIADLPKGFAEKHNIIVVPLNIHFGEEEIRTDELSVDEYYKKMRAADDLPKTSAPSPTAFYEAYKQVDPNTPILTVTLTEELSTTNQNAIIGKKMLLEEEPNRQIEVLNTRTASGGFALLLHEAIHSKRQDLRELFTYLKEKNEKVTTLFSLATVENVVKGGRLDRVRGAIAKTLNIKLLMRASEVGNIEVTEKIRGEKKALRRLVEQIGEYSSSLQNKTIALAHSNCEEKAKNVLESIREKYAPKNEFLVDMGPLIATYAGEGGIVISFFEE